MTNFDAWHLYAKDLFSPEHFVSWGWYSTIAAALERRVFFDNIHRPLYPCMYTVFVAPAGVGKGLVLDECIQLIKHPKPMAGPRPTLPPNPLNEAAANRPQRLLFSMAPDATTYESLLRDIVAATEHYKCSVTGKDKVQAALYFILDEYTSIFKQHAQELITFLLTAWNGKDYTRTTKNKGHDYVNSPLLNLLAGTTPSEFAKILRHEIIGTGIMGRTMLVYGHKNRGRGIRIPEPTPEQHRAHEQCKAWIKGLKSVTQCVTYTQEGYDKLGEWFADEARVRINPNPKLDEYYVRKLTHLHKLTMAMHFSEPGFEAPVPWATIQRAIDMLNETERDMHLALTAGGRNELSAIADAVVRYIGRNPHGVTTMELLDKFFVDAGVDDIQEITQALQSQQRVYIKNGRYYTNTP